MSHEKECIDKISDLITAAFSLIAALAWNSAIQEEVLNHDVVKRNVR